MVVLKIARHGSSLGPFAKNRTFNHEKYCYCSTCQNKNRIWTRNAKEVENRRVNGIDGVIARKLASGIVNFLFV